MSDQVFGDDEFDDGDDFDRGQRGGIGGKRGLLIAMILVLLVILALVAAWFMGAFDSIFDSMAGDAQPTQQVAATSQDTASADGGLGLINQPPYFYPPEMLVNLNATGGRNRFLKVSIALELRSDGDMGLVEANLPRIIDMFQNYLHGLSVEQLQAGPAGLDRLRDELQSRANDAVPGDAPVQRVLIQEMLVQ